jgi:hypothetical protein
MVGSPSFIDPERMALVPIHRIVFSGGSPERPVGGPVDRCRA